MTQTPDLAAMFATLEQLPPHEGMQKSRPRASDTPQNRILFVLFRSMPDKAGYNTISSRTTR